MRILFLISEGFRGPLFIETKTEQGGCGLIEDSLKPMVKI